MNKLEIAAVKVRNSVNQLFPGNYEKIFSSGIITAGGSGTRLGGSPKQLRELCGKPCILYSLLAFQACKDIDEIIVVVKDGQEDEIERLCKENGITKLKAVVLGGFSRQESVCNGFMQISSKSKIVAIHDAARPLILPSQISLLLEEANRYGAATAAKKCADTMKRADDKGMITETVPREDLYAVQTPQVFKADLYRVALALSKRDGFLVTDDCSLAENAGFSVKLCELDGPNFKLTTQDDLITITSILKERENG